MNDSTFKNYRFEDLEVWKLSLDIVKEVYLLVQKFPKTEIYALGDQLRRASTSIALNIAEGSGQPTKKLFCLYLQRSKSSVLECVACLKIALQQGFILEKDVKIFEPKAREIYFKLIAFDKSLKK